MLGWCLCRRAPRRQAIAWCNTRSVLSSLLVGPAVAAASPHPRLTAGAAPSLPPPAPLAAGVQPSVIAQRLAFLAFENSMDKHKLTPYRWGQWRWGAAERRLARATLAASMPASGMGRPGGMPRCISAAVPCHGREPQSNARFSQRAISSNVVDHLHRPTAAREPARPSTWCSMAARQTTSQCCVLP